MPQDFLFDIGNVILKFDFSLATGRLGAKMSRPIEDLLDPLEDVKMGLESGRIDDDTFISQAIELLGYEGTREDFSQSWCDIFELNEPMIEVICRLSENEDRLYLLSNTSGLHKDFFFDKYPVFGCFRDGVYSHTSKSMKPDEGMYRDAFDTFNLKPETTVYIDDHVENIATGNRLGLRSFLYDPARHDEVIAEMQAAGVEIG